MPRSRTTPNMSSRHCGEEGEAMEASTRLHAETAEPGIEGRRPLPCEHDEPGTWVRPDLIREYAARGYCCVHGHIAGEDER